MNRYKKLLSNTVLFAVGTFSSKALVFLLMPLYTAVLSTQEYGTVDLIMQAGNLLLPLVSVGIINSIVRFGLDASVFQFDKVCHSCAQLTPEEKRGFIGDVKRAAYSINRDVQRSFRDLEQTIQPDEFSVAAPKPAKASKAKTEKEPER